MTATGRKLWLITRSLKRAFAELEEARTANLELPDATDLFKLIDKQ